MSQVQIEVVAVKPYTEGKHNKMKLTYERDGTTTARTLVAIGKTEEVMNVLKDANTGDVYNINMEKSSDDKFWNWIGAEKVTEETKTQTTKAVTKPATYEKKNTYETPEERASKNLSICRQNALTNAVVFHTSKDGKSSLEEVIRTAAVMAAWNSYGETITDTNAKAKKAAKVAAIAVGDDIDDDIPF